MALLSLPRRFSELASPPADDESDETNVTPPHLAVTLAEAGEAAEGIEEVGADLRAVLIGEDPELSSSDGAESAVRTAGDATTALDRLRAAADHVAALADGQHGEAWTRTGMRPTGPVSAADLLREAVHCGVHHLRLAEQAS